MSFKPNPNPDPESNPNPISVARNELQRGSFPDPPITTCTSMPRPALSSVARFSSVSPSMPMVATPIAPIKKNESGSNDLFHRIQRLEKALGGSQDNDTGKGAMARVSALEELIHGTGGSREGKLVERVQWLESEVV